jgi:adenosylmethionine-8-amino-7-oxononanoate aminotransferase
MVRAIVHAIRDRGVLAGFAGTAIEFAPALIASRSDIDRTIEVTAEAVAAVTAR